MKFRFFDIRHCKHVSRDMPETVDQLRARIAQLEDELATQKAQVGLYAAVKVRLGACKRQVARIALLIFTAVSHRASCWCAAE